MAASSQPRARGPAANRQAQRAYYEHRQALMRMGEDACRLDDASAVRARCDSFFALCAEDGCKPTMAGLAVALGCTAGDIEAHPTRELWRACQCIEDITMQMALDGTAQMAPGIFAMKNWFGYADSSERGRGASRDPADRAEIERRYRNVELADPGDGKGRKG